MASWETMVGDKESLRSLLRQKEADLAQMGRLNEALREANLRLVAENKELKKKVVGRNERN